MNFTSAERIAIERILAGPAADMDILRAHFAHATVIERDPTGVGFYTKFSVPRTLPPMPDNLELRQILFAGTWADVRGRPDCVATFMLWEDDERYLSTLEGCLMGDGLWPRDEDLVWPARPA